MKIKTKKSTYEKVMSLSKPAHKKPIKPNIIFRTIIRVISIPDLFFTKFEYEVGDIKDSENNPCLILMNHSSFIDLEIASKILYPRSYSIICTSDGFVGKEWLMRAIGCIPTQKFVTSFSLISDIMYSLKKNKTSVLMYPEASYSFDGCATPLPKKLGILIKKLDVPVVTIITKGAFARDPLYNCLQKRKVKVSAEFQCIFSRNEIKSLSVEEIDNKINNVFSFDNFAWQHENKIEIKERFRADGLDRILYKCAACKTEGKMIGEGIYLKCNACGKKYELDVYGKLKALNGDTEFSHIPDWYKWERECVKKELFDKTYILDTQVDIGMMVDYKAIYMVGEGHLIHNENGFILNGCEDKLHYTQKPLASYGLYSDYYWYEIGDVICIGNKDCLYYCFPKTKGIVAKTRLAAEELYKICKEGSNNEKKMRRIKI